jgi:pimeloyl-ACP methyl ester carboxylesterase
MTRRTAIRTLFVAIALVAGLAPGAQAAGVQPRLDLADPAGMPSPSDRFTVPDATQRTGRRVDLPKPDCAVRPSDCEDIDVLDALDGFNLQARLSIPFTGPIDPATVNGDSVFLVSLAPGMPVIGINQVVWDPASNTLNAEPEEFLDQDGRYLLIVTDQVKDVDGDPIESTAFRRFLNFGKTSDPLVKAYRLELIEALDLVEGNDVFAGHVAVASLFTTQSATRLMETIRDQVLSAPAPADFLLGTGGARTVFPLAGITGISFSRQTSIAPAFQTAPLPLNLLATAPGAVGTIAFGRYESPNYEAPGQFIPPVGTLTGVPAVQGTASVLFDLTLPSGTEPANGWPVVLFVHGLNANKSTFLRVAGRLAQQGLATLAINAVGHGGGPLGSYAVTRTDGTVVSLTAGGRGFDQDGNGAIGTSEGLFAAPPRTLLQLRDGSRQTVIDLMQAVRVIQAGVDVDGDGLPDLDAAHISYYGGSGGGLMGAPFLALAPDVASGVVAVLGGPFGDWARLSAARPLVGAAFAARTPSLLNGGPDPFLPSNPFPFRENLPLRNQPPVINDIAGAMALQAQLDRSEWAMQAGDPVAYARHLRAAPLAGMPSKNVLVQFAKGDKQFPNPTTSAFLRAGGLDDRATYFRNDLAFAANPALPKDPHQFWYNVFTSPAVTALALQAEDQAAAFLASDGVLIVDPDGAGALYETPIAGPLPEELSLIP